MLLLQENIFSIRFYQHTLSYTRLFISKLNVILSMYAPCYCPIFFKKKPPSYKQTMDRCRPSRDKMKCTNLKTAHKYTQKLHVKAHYYCMQKVHTQKKSHIKLHVHVFCCDQHTWSHLIEHHQTNKQTNNTTKNKHNKTIYSKMATICVKRICYF